MVCNVCMYVHDCCKDIDECDEDVAGCTQLCINSIGSYACNCENGYQLGSDNQTCFGTIDLFCVIITHVDINECTNTNGGCEQNCSNTAGSYSCSCATGFLLHDNNYNCTGSRNY